MIRPFLLLALLAAPAMAQVAVPDEEADGFEVGILSCDLDGTETGCLTEAPAEDLTFCMAVDAEGEPVANATTVSDEGVVVFQNVEPERIAALRCRPEA